MAEVVALIEAVVARQSELVIAREITPAQAPGKFETGQARVLLRVDDLVRRVAGHFAGALPRIYEALQMPGAPAARLSGQIAAINDGESIQFRGAPAGAELTFVLMLHREPKAFSGGELLVHGARLRRGRWVRADEHRSVDVRPGRLVAFPSRYAHEVARVECRSRALADGLFTLTGWLMR
jgi:predicted 2-oxoglutarate/Fe(II)-dependent dioxygenase YbiX